MTAEMGDRFDFFLSRRGSVAAIAREVANVLIEAGYKVFVQDYDIPLTASFIEAIDNAIRNARDLVILFTRDYEKSPYTRKEFTSFEAERAQSAEVRRIVILRCEDAPLRGLLADNVYQDLVGIEDATERRRRIIAAAEGQSQAIPPPPKPFIAVPPRLAAFTGRADELDQLDAILVQDKPAAGARRDRKNIARSRIRAPFSQPVCRRVVVPGRDSRNAGGEARVTRKNVWGNDRRGQYRGDRAGGIAPVC
jgi:hypothetical protein